MGVVQQLQMLHFLAGGMIGSELQATTAARKTMRSGSDWAGSGFYTQWTYVTSCEPWSRLLIYSLVALQM